MKNNFAKVFTFIGLMLLGISAAAQEKIFNLENHFKPYGFLRTYSIFDTRDSKAGSEDLFYYIPMDKALNRQGKDIYSNPSLKMYAITTRLGVNMSGYQYGNLKVYGKVEGDFYLMNGNSASFRLRQAYSDLVWDSVGYMENLLGIRVGQAWHPMSEDMPYCINVESGSPFNPYNRSPQVMFRADLVNHWEYTFGALYPMQHLPTGPAGPSENYVKYGMIPEGYAGICFHAKGFKAKVGSDVLYLRPRWRTTTTDNATYDAGTKVKDRLLTYCPFIYLEGQAGSFRINAKSVYANGGDHLSLMGGYALTDMADIYDWKYTPLRSTVSFLSFCFGRKVQFMCMGGYMRTLGTLKEVVNNNGVASLSAIYYYSDGFPNINQMLRATPTVAFNAGKLTVAAEYDFTTVQYGDIGLIDRHVLPGANLRWIVNHRAMLMLKFDF